MLYAKLFALGKQLEHHEVDVLELERQVQMMEEENEKMAKRLVEVECLSGKVDRLSAVEAQPHAAFRASEDTLSELVGRVNRIATSVQDGMGDSARMNELTSLPFTSLWMG